MIRKATPFDLEFVKSLAGTLRSDHQKVIQDNLKELLDL